MSSSKVSVAVEPPTELAGMAFVAQIVDPEIDAFSIWFSDPKRGDGGISGFEREILRSYLWWAMKERPNGG